MDELGTYLLKYSNWRLMNHLRKSRSFEECFRPSVSGSGAYGTKEYASVSIICFKVDFGSFSGRDLSTDPTSSSWAYWIPPEIKSLDLVGGTTSSTE